MKTLTSECWRCGENHRCRYSVLGLSCWYWRFRSTSPLRRGCLVELWHHSWFFYHYSNCGQWRTNSSSNQNRASQYWPRYHSTHLTWQISPSLELGGPVYPITLRFHRVQNMPSLLHCTQKVSSMPVPITKQKISQCNFQSLSDSFFRDLGVCPRASCEYSVPGSYCRCGAEERWRDAMNQWAV